MIVKIVLSLMIAFTLMLLSGCAAPARTEMPSYIVMLTEGNVLQTDKRCTGAAISPYRVVTARHCVEGGDADRLVTQYGQELKPYVLATWDDADVALLGVHVPMLLESYASFRDALTTNPAEAFGVCPLYFSHVPREVHYHHSEIMQVAGPINGGTRPRPCAMWVSHFDAICGGDSGGVLVQDGEPVAMTVAVRTPIWFYNFGYETCAIPSFVINKKLDEFEKVGAE